MKVCEDSNDQNETPKSSRERMEEIHAHYQSYVDLASDPKTAHLDTSEIQSVETIMDRIIILSKLGVARTTLDEEEQRELLSDIQRDWWFKATPLEKYILELKSFPEDGFNVELLYIGIIDNLFWVLGHELAYVSTLHQLANPAFYDRIEEILSDPDAFKRQASMRPMIELLKERADTYGAYIDCKLDFDEFGEDINLFLGHLTERFIVLCWLFGADWDDALHSMFEDTFCTKADGTEFDLEEYDYGDTDDDD